ncbi:hypothetical protein AYI70_g5189 [Smittium culicis]|uniref:Uncharacterized protein n=1 Tax=Smittium culicis TaxID=133412 RepID=A0A1R1XVN2_9FUNG|nr:hypothetical protein AYI70_g5189 [Smittium culicis]
MPIGCYGGETFVMSEARCWTILMEVDRAIRMVANVGKSAAMECIRDELGISSVFMRTSTACERAYHKWSTSKTWIAYLIKAPMKARMATWVTGSARWIKKFCSQDSNAWLGLVVKLLMGESRQPLSQLRSGIADHNFELETAKFLNGMHVPRTLILQSISDSPVPLVKFSVGMELLERLRGID